MELPMAITDMTYQELANIKEEINDFIDSKLVSFEELEKNNIRFVLKKIVLTKYLLIHNKSDYRYKALSSDLMYLINSIKKGEIRYYFFNLRSIIEQALRIINNINSTEIINNVEVMNQTQELINSHGFYIELDVIRESYKTSCLYVHGNESVDIGIIEYYENSFEKNVQIKNVRRKLKVLIKLLTNLFDLIILIHVHEVDAAFHRRKTILKYLIGEKSYNEFYKVIEE